MLRPFSVLLLGLAFVSSTTHWAKINKTLDMTCHMPEDGEKLEVCAWKMGDEGAFKSSFKKSDSRISIIMVKKNCSISINRVEKKDEGYWYCMMSYEDKEYRSLVFQERLLSKIDHSFDWTCSMPDDGEKLQLCSWRIGEEGAFNSSFEKSHGGDPRITVSQTERNCSIRMEKVEEADGGSIECKVHYQHWDGSAMTLSKRRSIMEQPPLPQDQNGSSTNGANKNPGFKLKINEGEASTPLPHLPDEDPEDKLPNAYVDFSGDDDGETSAKLSKLNDEDYIETSSGAAVGNNPTSSNSLPLPLDPLADRSDSSVPPPPNYTSMQGVPNLLHHGSENEDMKRVPHMGHPVKTTYDKNCHDGNPVHREILGKRDVHHRPEHLKVAPLPFPEHHQATFQNNVGGTVEREKTPPVQMVYLHPHLANFLSKNSSLDHRMVCDQMSETKPFFDFAYSAAVSFSAGAGGSTTAEVGVAFGLNNAEVMFYASGCVGLKADVSYEFDLSIGFWRSLSDILGHYYMVGGGVETNDDKTDETEANCKLIKNDLGELVGGTVSLGVGEGPELPIGWEVNIDKCYAHEILKFSLIDVFETIWEKIGSKLSIKILTILTKLTHESDN